MQRNHANQEDSRHYLTLMENAVGEEAPPDRTFRKGWSRNFQIAIAVVLLLAALGTLWYSAGPHSSESPRQLSTIIEEALRGAARGTVAANKELIEMGVNVPPTAGEIEVRIDTQKGIITVAIPLPQWSK